MLGLCYNVIVPKGTEREKEIDIMKRFVKEYALYKIEQVKLNPELDREFKAAYTEEIKKILFACERGILSVDSAMQAIAFGEDEQ